MLDRVPIKTRLIAILVLLGVVTLFLAAYLKQTAGLYGQLKSWEQKNATAANADVSLATYQQELVVLDAQVKNLKQDHLELDDQILYLEYIEILSGKHQLQLISMPRETLVEQDGYRVAQVDLTVAGSFRNMVSFLYAIEQEDRIGTIDHLSFLKEIIRTQRGRTPLLKATIRINRLLNALNNTNGFTQTATK